MKVEVSGYVPLAIPCPVTGDQHTMEKIVHPDSISKNAPCLSHRRLKESNKLRQGSRSMNPERWQRIEALFRTVVERPAAERKAYLTLICGGDAELQHEVLSLIARDQSEDFLQKPIANIALSLDS